MLKLYSHPLSGNAYKVKLLLSFLGLDYENIDVALEQGEHRQPPFLALNPFGQIPVLVDNDVVLADAQAILVYIARQYGGEQADSWFPTDPLSMAQVGYALAIDHSGRSPSGTRVCKALPSF